MNQANFDLQNYNLNQRPPILDALARIGSGLLIHICLALLLLLLVLIVLFITNPTATVQTIGLIIQWIS